MASNTDFQFHIPGAYTFDTNPAPSFGADVFRPPISVAAAAAAAATATASPSASTPPSLFSEVPTTPSTNIHAKRKRPANDASREGTPLPSDWGHMSVESDDRQVVYTLAGQIDNDVSRGGGLDDSVYDSAYADVDYRRALGRRGTTTTNNSAAPPPPPTATPSTLSTHDRWTVLHALGNVVGKVWEFCTTGAFRGFHAGGGAGYDWETGRPTGAETGTGTEVSGTGTEPTQLEPEAAPPPEAPRAATPTTPTQHVGKRRHVVSRAGDELARSWVMVQPEERQPQQRQQRQQQQQQQRGAARRTTTGATTTSTTRTSTPKSRTATMGTASSAARAVRPASPAPRPSFGGGSSSSSSRPNVPPPPPPSRRISTPVASRRGTSSIGPLPKAATTATPSATPPSRLRVSHAGSPGLQPRELASFASPRSPISAVSSPRRGVRANTLSGQAPSFSGSGSPAGSVSGRTPRAQKMTANPVNPFARGGGEAASSPRPGSRAHHRSQSSLSGIRSARKIGGGPSVALDDTLAASPRLTDEAKRLAAQQRAADADADAKMEAFNARLQEMIRQGQEALGTRFEVEEEEEEEDRRACWDDL